MINKSSLFVSTLALCLSCANPAWSQVSSGDLGGRPRPTPAPSQNPGTTPNPYAPPSSTSRPAYSGGQTAINDGAKKAQQAAYIGAGVSAAMAGMFFRMCATTPNGGIYCAMGAMSAAQGLSHLTSAGSAGRTRGATQGGGVYGDGDPWGGGPNPSDGDPNDPNNPYGPGAGGPGGMTGNPSADLRRIQDNLRKIGYEIGPDGKSVRTPDGKSIPMAALASADGLRALGASDADLANIENMRAKALEKMKDKMVSMQLEGGGGGRGQNSASSTAGTEKPFDFNAMFADKNKVRKPASVKGLSKQLGSDRIGVPDDNIFEMISRQYKKEAGRSGFIGAAAGPATNSPKPASLPGHQ